MVQQGEKQGMMSLKKMMQSPALKETDITNRQLPSTIYQISRRVKLKVVSSEDMTKYPTNIKPILRFVF
jgi:hypothetical protein